MRLKTSLTLATLALAGLPASAGIFDYSPLTGDADSTITNQYNYTAKADFLGTGRTINGVTFSDTAATGTNYVLTGTPDVFTGNGNSVGGSTGGMLSDFFYSGATAGNASLTLSGLTIGQQYITTWYNAAFGGPGGRVIDITPSDTGKIYRFDENFSGAGNGNLLRYVFTATDTFITYNFNAANDGDSFHHYAFSNAVANPALYATGNVTALTGPGQPGPNFAPFTVRNNDLLQTRASIASSSGTFTTESAGGLPVLTDGNFSIHGGNVGSGTGDNSMLATVGNGAFIEYALDLGFSPFGYDISSIETYGGWNDSGRDKQLFRVLYSLVGSASFTEIAGMDFNPTDTGDPSAVRGIFNTTLSGVDAIRFEFPTGQENGYVGMGELDVVGTATVPEPAGAMLMLVGGMALISRRRRG